MSRAVDRAIIRDAMPGDAGAVAALRNAVAEVLTLRHGPGHWSSRVTERSALGPLTHARVRVAEVGQAIVAVARLQVRKPWAIDTKYFTAVQTPLYLVNLVVSPVHQGHGIGRLVLEDARAVAQAWPANAIRLDAYDHEAGAGAFYRRCGYAERGGVVYRGTPLRYFELLLRPDGRARS